MELTEMTANHPMGENGCEGEFCDGIHNVCAKCSNSVPSPSQFILAQRYRRQVELAQADRDRRRNAHANGYHGPLTRNDLAAMAR